MSEQNVKLILGLGNVGSDYAGTRHNVGFYCIDRLAAGLHASWHDKPKFMAQVAEHKHKGQKIILAKPTTFYNLSGEAAHAIANFYKITPRSILVIHDELDLPFGKIRTRIGGSDAGNNGIKNLSTYLDENYARIRVGIANGELAQQDATDFVLDRFSATEQQLLPKIAEHVESFVWEFVVEDADFLHTSVQVL
jgi:peptidyl-tRNA hydrolase, PTH1 family